MWNLRLAGWKDGYPHSDEEFIAEIKAIRRRLLASGDGHFLPDSFYNLSQLAAECRLLIVEWIEGGSVQIEGCVSFTLANCICADPETGELSLQRANFLRLLSVRESPNRSKIALRLVHEAMLRGTIRSRHDGGPYALGTLGIVFEENERALGWVAKQGSRVRILARDDADVEKDPPLRWLRDYADDKHVQLKLDQGYRIVVLNRVLLQDAALLNLIGREIKDPSGAAELDVRYELTDPFAWEIEVAVANIVRQNPDTLELLAIAGDCKATVWGPREGPGMRVGGISGAAGWEDFAS